MWEQELRDYAARFRERGDGSPLQAVEVKLWLSASDGG